MKSIVDEAISRRPVPRFISKTRGINLDNKMTDFACDLEIRGILKCKNATSLIERVILKINLIKQV